MIRKEIYLILLIILFLAGCQTRTNKPESADVAIPVITSPVSKISIGKEIILSGNIEGNKTVRLGFMVAGKINFIGIDEGQPVRKENLLASLDPTSYSIARELAEIQVNQVQDEYDRLKSMHDKNSLSESDFAKVSFGLQQAKAQLKLHSKNLSDTKLYSPIDGVLLKKLCEVGEITGTGIPLFVVSDIHKVKVNAYIPENELQNIKIGQTARVIISSLDNTYEGKIIEVSSAADPSSRAFSVKIEVQNPQMLIRPGMIAEVSITSDRKKEVPVIPVEAILHDFNGQSYVYVADVSQNKAFRRNVSLGTLVNDKIEITSGLGENEIIVTGGQQKLVDASPIIINK
jgi:RND family efflux transporter MFP subunit